MKDGQDPESAQALLKERLISGAYRPGQRLTEMDLAAELGIGRGKVREALRTLVGEGYLEFEANRGAVVRRHSRAEILEIGRVRESLEGLAARLAAETGLTREDSAMLSACQDAMDRAEETADIGLFDRENAAFHRMIAILSGSGTLNATLQRIRLPLVRLQLPRSFSIDSMARSNRDHRVITAAILSASPDAAEAAMRAHVRAGNAHIAALPSDAFR